MWVRHIMCSLIFCWVYFAYYSVFTRIWYLSLGIYSVFTMRINRCVGCVWLVCLDEPLNSIIFCNSSNLWPELYSNDVICFHLHFADSVTLAYRTRRITLLFSSRNIILCKVITVTIMMEQSISRGIPFKGGTRWLIYPRARVNVNVRLCCDIVFL